MRAPRAAIAASALLLVGCTPAAPQPTASAIETPGLVAPYFAPLAPGSPTASLPNLSPAPAPKPTSPLPKTLGEWVSYRERIQDDGAIQVFYSRESTPKAVVSAAVMPSNKSDAQLETAWPDAKRYSKAWCARQSPTTIACVVKVEPGRAVLALGNDVTFEELGQITTDLAATL